jgi:hypothetical protein
MHVLEPIIPHSAPLNAAEAAEEISTPTMRHTTQPLGSAVTIQSTPTLEA